MTEVAITGFGVFTPLDIDAPSTWEVTLVGRSGVHTLPCDRAEPLPATFAAEAAGDPNEKLNHVTAHRLDWSSQFAMIVGQEAWEDAGFGLGEDNSTNSDRLAACVGTGTDGLYSLLGNWDIQKEKGPRRISSFTIPMLMADAPAADLGLKFGAAAGTYAPVSTCASSNEVISLGLGQIRLGHRNIVVVGGSEGVIHPLSVNTFTQMQALSRRNDDPEHASRPQDTGHDRFVLGEGPVIMVIETLEHTCARGVCIYGTFTGAGISSDNHDMVQPEPMGRGQSTTMRKAFQISGLQPGDIKRISTHGTSTPRGSLTEASSIATALGSAVDECIVTSTKSMNGYLLGSTGALGTFATVMALRNRIVPPTINTEGLEPGFPIDITVNESHRLLEDDLVALNNFFGFEGSSVVVTMANANITN